MHAPREQFLQDFRRGCACAGRSGTISPPVRTLAGEEARVIARVSLRQAKAARNRWITPTWKRPPRRSSRRSPTRPVDMTPGHRRPWVTCSTASLPNQPHHLRDALRKRQCLLNWIIRPWTSIQRGSPWIHDQPQQHSARLRRERPPGADGAFVRVAALHVTAEHQPTDSRRRGVTAMHGPRVCGEDDDQATAGRARNRPSGANCCTARAAGLVAHRNSAPARRCPATAGRESGPLSVGL